MKRNLILLVLFFSSIYVNAQIDNDPTNDALPGDMLSLSTNNIATISSSSDVDIFKVSIPASGVLIINVTGTNTNMKTRVELINPNGTTSEGYRDSNFVSDDVRLEILAQTSGNYFIKIRNTNSTVNSSPYILNATLDSDDTYEFNNGLSGLSTLNPISISLDENFPNILQGKIQGYYRTNFSSVDSNNFVVLSPDRDIYKITTNTDQGVLVMNLENVPSNLKLSIEVLIPDSSSFNGERSLGIREATSNGQPLNFELLTTFAGEYYIRIKNENGELNTSTIGNTSSSPYTLKIWLDKTGNEYNNSIESLSTVTAIPLSLDENSPNIIQGKIRGYYRTNFTSVGSNEFVVLSADRDIYKVTTNTNQGVIVMNLENVPSNLKLSIEVLIPDSSSSNGERSLGIREAASNGQPLNFELLTTFAGEYFIRIKNENGELNTSTIGNTSSSLYTLKVSLDATACEFNNTILSACSVNANESINAKIRGHYRTNFTSVGSNNFEVLTTDFDYYQPNLCNTFTSASVTNVPSNLKIKITVYDITGTNSLGSKTAINDGDSVTINSTDLTNINAAKYFRIENINGVNATNTNPNFYTIIFTCSPLGVEESVSNSNFSIYPNPALSILNLQFDANVTIDKIVITDLTGKRILEQTSNNSQINIENLAKGTYIIEAYSTNKKFQIKFIKE